MSFARNIAYRYQSRAERMEDLIQVSYLALVGAIQRFDPERGIPFVVFASPTINGELKRHYRDRISTIRVPRPIYERIGNLEAATTELNGKLAHATDAELAEEMDCTTEEIREARSARDARHPIPFEPSGDDGRHMDDLLGEVDLGFSEADDHIALSEALAGLDRTDKAILKLRFQDEMTQSEIAECLDCSQMHVSRKLRLILSHLNESVSGQGECASSSPR